MAALPVVMLDVGSTNSRAWLVRGTEICARATAAVGVRDSARTGSTAIVRQVVRELFEAVAAGVGTQLIAAAGMITSPLGLVEVPHVPAPASPEDLARAALVLRAPELAGVPLVLVPGVRTVPARAASPFDADVMRGEETLAIGAMGTGVLPRGGRLLTAGLHWKLTWTDADGRIAGSRTSLGGETVHAWQAATLLRSSLPEGPLTAFDRGWVDAGAAATRAGGLLRAAFQVRVLEQAGGTSPEQRLNWIVGASVASDLDSLFASGHLHVGAPVVIAGASAVSDVWGHLLAAAGCVPSLIGQEAAEQAFVTGLGVLLAARAGGAGPAAC